MPNLTGYEDTGGGTAALHFDDGQVIPNVVLDDKLKSEVTAIAAQMSPQLRAPVVQPLTAAPAAVPVAPVQPMVNPQAPAPASGIAPSAPVAPVAPVAPDIPSPAGLRPSLQETEDRLGGEGGTVRQLSTEAAAAEEATSKAILNAKADAVSKKADLIGDRLAEIDTQRQLDAIEATHHEAAIAEASKKYAQVSQQQPDPTQAFGGSPAWFKVLTLIGMAAGAARNGNGSAALDEVNKTIDMSLDAQKNVKNSEIQRLTGILGSEQAGLAAAKARMQKVLEDRLTMGLLQADNEGEAAFFRASLGKATSDRKRSEAEAIKATATSVRNQMTVPKPVKAGVGGPTDLASQEYANIYKAHGVDPKRMNLYGVQRAKTGADQTIDLVDAATDTIGKLAEGQDVPGVGPIDKFWDAWTRDPDGAAVQQVLGMTKSAFIKSVSGASTTDSERKTLGNIVEGRATKDDLERGLALMKRQARSQLRTLDSSHAPEADAYEDVLKYRSRRDAETSRKARLAADAANNPVGPPVAPAAPVAPTSALDDYGAVGAALKPKDPGTENPGSAL